MFFFLSDLKLSSQRSRLNEFLFVEHKLICENYYDYVTDLKIIIFTPVLYVLLLQRG